MRDLIKLMLIPIVGMIGIGTIFLFVIYGGEWKDDITYENNTAGMATKDLRTYDDHITYTGECDANTFRPVCGLDGETYDNACYAMRAGTKVAHLGACGQR